MKMGNEAVAGKAPPEPRIAPRLLWAVRAITVLGLGLLWIHVILMSPYEYAEIHGRGLTIFATSETFIFASLFDEPLKRIGLRIQLVLCPMIVFYCLVVAVADAAFPAWGSNSMVAVVTGLLHIVLWGSVIKILPSLKNFGR